MRMTRVLLVVASLWSSCFLVAQSHSDPPLLIKAVKIIDVDAGIVRAAEDVLVSNGRIAEIAKRITGPAGATEIEGRGKFLIPGLWDMHVHLAGLSADPAWSRELLLPLLVANGVTGVRDMGGDLEALQQWKKEIAAKRLMGPEIVAAGPMLDGEFDDPNVLKTRNPQEARQNVAQLKARGADFVKVLSGLDRDTYFAAMSAAKENRMILVGHVPPPIGPDEASNAGQKSIEHILYSGIAISCSAHPEALREKWAAAMKSGAIRQIAKVEDSAIADYSLNSAQDLWKTFVRNKTWLTPTLHSTYSSAHLAELVNDDPALQYLPKTLSASWTSEKLQVSLAQDKLEWWGRELRNQLKLVREMHAAGVRLLAGTDSLDPHNVPGASMAHELELLVEAGLTPRDAVRTATLGAAEFFDRKDIGDVKIGSKADLVLLNANPLEDIANVGRIEAVILAGTLLRRAELDKMLAQAKTEAGKW
jgi:imidazolonepropionase-like amidohydrolase